MALSAWLVAAACTAATASCAQPFTHPDEFVPRFSNEVDRRLTPPPAEIAYYGERVQRALAAAGVRIDRTQFVLLIDRSAAVQAALLWWVAPDGATGWIGASPVSTGRPAGFEHFETPLGVFEHSLAHPDFRAEGTKNEFGIRGYGRRGLRVFDFGWVVAARAWAPGEQAMRLQLHATDPDVLEPRLGQRESKGCIRIATTLNLFIDRYGVLDAAYDEALAEGHRFWVLRADRVPTPWAGRWMIVIDSQRTVRPAWSPAPRQARGVAASASAAPLC